jgi:hypothetical protein
MLKQLCIAGLVGLALAAQAEVFRCEANGKTEYTDEPNGACQSLGLKPVEPDPDAFAQMEETREAYRKDMDEWREGYIRGIERQTEALRAAAQRPVFIYTQPAEPVYPVYPWYPWRYRYGFRPDFGHHRPSAPVVPVPKTATGIAYGHR